MEFKQELAPIPSHDDEERQALPAGPTQETRFPEECFDLINQTLRYEKGSFTYIARTAGINNMHLTRARLRRLPMVSFVRCAYIICYRDEQVFKAFWKQLGEIILKYSNE